MFKNLIQAIADSSRPIEPRQGKRLLKEELPNGDLVYTIKGQGRPGLLILFGLMFAVIPGIFFFTILFGITKVEGGPSDKIITTLFIIPFVLIGLGTLFSGLFLWLGSTRLTLGSQNLNLQPRLFGKIIRPKSLPRSGLEIHFKESHRNNDHPVFKLSISNNAKEIGIGGSLKEAELLWLYHELKAALGEEPAPVMSIAEAMAAGGLETIKETSINSNYRSRNLQFTRTTSGWEARSRSTFAMSVGVIAFGSIFLIVGLLVGETTRRFLLDLVPEIRDAVSSYSSSGEGPPDWFHLPFVIAGAAVVLYGIFILGFRLTISRVNSRLIIDRRWIFLFTSETFQLSELNELEIKAYGHVNNVPRYRLDALFKDGKKIKLIGFASAPDVGQLHAHLRNEIKNGAR
ncbi:hypothetical protein V2O64_12210 [Verrucomicrobiaceae bacterium 227]